MTKMWEIFLFFLSLSLSLERVEFVADFREKCFIKFAIKSKKWYKGFKNDFWPYAVDDSKNLWNSKKMKSKLAKISLFFTKTFRKIMKRNPYFHEEEKIEFFWKKVSFEYFWSSSYHTRDKYKKYFHTKYLLNETFYIFCFFLLIFHDSCWGFYKLSFGFFNFFILFQLYFL